jgi:hypothetical protein
MARKAAWFGPVALKVTALTHAATARRKPNERLDPGTRVC